VPLGAAGSRCCYNAACVQCALYAVRMSLRGVRCACIVGTAASEGPGRPHDRSIRWGTSDRQGVRMRARAVWQTCKLHAACCNASMLYGTRCPLRATRGWPDAVLCARGTLIIGASPSRVMFHRSSNERQASAVAKNARLWRMCGSSQPQPQRRRGAVPAQNVAERPFARGGAAVSGDRPHRTARLGPAVPTIPKAGRGYCSTPHAYQRATLSARCFGGGTGARGPGPSFNARRRAQGESGGEALGAAP
jgi:hypothetical protein